MPTVETIVGLHFGLGLFLSANDAVYVFDTIVGFQSSFRLVSIVDVDVDASTFDALAVVATVNTIGVSIVAAIVIYDACPFRGGGCRRRWVGR